MSIKAINWKYVRIIYVLTGIISGFRIHTQKIGFPSPWTISLVLLIVMPLMMLLVMAINSLILPQNWNPPCWDLNPLLLNEPFQLFHVISWQAIISGVFGWLLLPWTGYKYAGQAALSIAFGFSGLLGIYFSMRVFRKHLRNDFISAKAAFLGYWQKPKSVK